MSDTISVPPAAGREQALAEVFVRLADSLVDDFDVVDLLDHLVVGVVRLLGASAAGLLLDDQKGSLALVASSSEESRLLEIFQLQTNEGPCLDCVRQRVAVVSADLEADIERWPVFVPAAREMGFHSVMAVPMRLRNQTIGGLNLFHSEVVPLTDGDQHLSQALADVATIAILQQRSAHRSSQLTEQLQHALNSRVTIEQAKGVLRERHGVALDGAFDMLRRYSRNNNVKLSEVALAVVRGEIMPSAAADDK